MAMMETMTARRAETLLTELEVGFSKKAFQTRLQKIDKAAAESLACSAKLSHGPRRQVIDDAYLDIFARYGFKQNADSEEQLVPVMKAMSTHFPDLATRVEAIFKVLCLDHIICTEADGEHSKQITDTDVADQQSDSVDASEAPKEDADKACCPATPSTAATSTPQIVPGEIEAADLEFFDADVLPESVPLGRDEALALQTELLQEFSSPLFQKQLHELTREHNVKDRRDGKYSAAFRQLVRGVQLRILPRHGFEASEKGVEAMLAAFKHLKGDQDVFVQSVAIKDALNSAACPASPIEQIAPRRCKPQTVGAMTNLLQGQLEIFTMPRFQRAIKHLKEREMTKYGCAAECEGWYRLNGRKELAFVAQKSVLVAWGFEASHEGLQDMLVHCAKFIKDEKVASLLDANNEKLGMTPAASARFRTLVASLA